MPYGKRGRSFTNSHRRGLQCGYNSILVLKQAHTTIGSGKFKVPFRRLPKSILDLRFKYYTYSLYIRAAKYGVLDKPLGKFDENAGYLVCPLRVEPIRGRSVARWEDRWRTPAVVYYYYYFPLGEFDFWSYVNVCFCQIFKVAHSFTKSSLRHVLSD